VSERDPKVPDSEAAGEPFLRRWSRLKSEAKDTSRPDLRREDAHPSQDSPQHPPARTEAAAPGVTALPDLESLDQDSDYSAFLSPDVDPSLRRLALRKLFRSPKFNVCDGLDDYSEDFREFAPLAGIVTADMRHHLERAATKIASSFDESKPRTPDGLSDAATTACTAGDDNPAPATAETNDDADRGPA
jgi:hypothetical protein